MCKDEIMDEEQFKLVMTSDNPTVEALEEIENSKKQKSKTDNEQALVNAEKTEISENSDENSHEKYSVKKKENTSENQDGENLE